MKTKTLVFLGTLVMLLPQAQANTTVLSDSTFSNVNWSSVSLLQFGAPAAVVSFGQVGAGGNPGSYMAFSATQGALNSIPQYNIVAGILGIALLQYNPSTQGAITGISFSTDLEGLSPSAGCFVNPFIEQNGKYFVTGQASTYVSGTTGWATLSGAISNPATAFSCYNALGQQISGGLDLTSTGGAITFGIGVEEGSGAPIYGNFGVDNISYTLTTTDPLPEPSTYAAAVMGFGMLVGIQQLRKRVK
jgi:hypothetical protein